MEGKVGNIEYLMPSDNVLKVVLLHGGKIISNPFPTRLMSTMERRRTSAAFFSKIPVEYFWKWEILTEGEMVATHQRGLRHNMRFCCFANQITRFHTLPTNKKMHIHTLFSSQIA